MQEKWLPDREIMTIIAKTYEVPRIVGSSKTIWQVPRKVSGSAK